jgi:hypothetical protein
MKVQVEVKTTCFVDNRFCAEGETIWVSQQYADMPWFQRLDNAEAQLDEDTDQEDVVAAPRKRGRPRLQRD